MKRVAEQERLKRVREEKRLRLQQGIRTSTQQNNVRGNSLWSSISDILTFGCATSNKSWWLATSKNILLLPFGNVLKNVKFTHLLLIFSYNLYYFEGQSCDINSSMSFLVYSTASFFFSICFLNFSASFIFFFFLSSSLERFSSDCLFFCIFSRFAIMHPFISLASSTSSTNLLTFSCNYWFFFS